MTDLQFRALMNLVMRSDPTPLTSAEDDSLVALLNERAIERNYPNWETAFHLFKKADR